MYAQLKQHFMEGVSSTASANIGVEAETIYVDEYDQPVDASVTQDMLKRMLASDYGWSIEEKGRYHCEERISSIKDGRGNRVIFEIGHCNLETVSRVAPPSVAIRETQSVLAQIERAALHTGKGRPFRGPVVRPTRSVLSPMSERERNFLALDGHEVTNMMACTASVQFTIEVTRISAIPILRSLHEHMPEFLAEYPQEENWRTYVRDSKAGYRADRYGGPLRFDSLPDYCGHLSQHRVLTEHGLRAFDERTCVDIPMFIKSVWWYVRLKRYGDQLCLEIRPMSRTTDEDISTKWDFVRSIIV